MEPWEIAILVISIIIFIILILLITRIRIVKQTEKIVENFGVYCIIENKFYYMTKQGVSQFLILNDKYKLQYTIQK